MDLGFCNTGVCSIKITNEVWIQPSEMGRKEEIFNDVLNTFYLLYMASNIR